MHIKDNEILLKIIECQSSIIAGKSIKSILYKNIDFFLDKSEADIITVYIPECEKVQLEYILEKDKLFTTLSKQYMLNHRNFSWNKFVSNCDKHPTSDTDYTKITELSQLFKGLLNKKESAYFAGNIKMKSAIIMPFHSSNNTVLLGYVCFIFQSDSEINLKKLETVKSTFEMLLRPLHDREHNTLYNKCICIDEDMHFLTDKERKVVKHVLTGMNYNEVAARLDISINTLKTHMKNIFYKTNVNSKIELFNKFNVRV